eukprot:13805894-Alexandrium_andersonii.AAC.1
MPFMTRSAASLSNWPQLAEDADDVARRVRAGSRHLRGLPSHLFDHYARCLANALCQSDCLEHNGGHG